MNTAPGKYLRLNKKINDTAFELTEFALPALIVNNNKNSRVESIDLLRGLVMIIMALDHVRNYFHRDAFFYSPTDLTQTNAFLFFTRFITHYCAPVFVFLAGISSFLYGAKRSRKELSIYLFTRGLWLVLAEMLIITLGWTFNPSYPMFNLQVIWAIGISMMVLSVMVFLDKRIILSIGLLLIAGHNLLDEVHVSGNGVVAFGWSLLHESKDFIIGGKLVSTRYPVLPWIGIMATGYCFGNFYTASFATEKRIKVLLLTGLAAIAAFLLLRGFNIYGDYALWTAQKNSVFSMLSFFNVTKYPPSLLYVLVTLGPALIFLALMERPLNFLTEKVVLFGRVPFFYYVLHIYLIHALALICALASGYNFRAMILHNKVNRVMELKGYGFNLLVVYAVWMLVLLLLYPLCKCFAGYKKKHQGQKVWLRYL